ncbi:hypothetical protein WMF31_29655 [Sorangium sp. So ce1036]|uniref:hypothetical protein n=1 Tax=Sorangium sp. So ce1036 TaxID=3133328 RepID=UPI003F09F192
MSRYRSELEVVRFNIDELEERLHRVREEQIRLEAEANLGPRAPRLFSRSMYHLGRALARLWRRRPHAPAQELATARARLAWLEERVAAAEAALSQARDEAARRARESAPGPGSTPPARPTPTPPYGALPRGAAYALGRTFRRLRRR